MLGLLGFFLIVLLVCLSIWIIADTFYYFSITPKGYYNPIKFKEYGVFHKIFVDFPRQFGKDLARKDSNIFDSQGLIVFEGRQGSGKTISMIHYSNLLKARFPECKVLSNTDCIFADGKLNNWQDLLDLDNGIFGVVAQIDECQLWANNRNWKSKDNPFNWDMVQEICFNRKHKRCILATTQNFSMLDKQIRLQTTEIRKCFTFLGCVTFVFRSSPLMDSEGNLLKKQPKGFYWFVQSDFLRSCYDTNSTVKALRSIGFAERSVV